MTKALLNNSTEITPMGYFYKYTCSDRSINLCIQWDACHELFSVLLLASELQGSVNILSVLDEGKLSYTQNILICNALNVPRFCCQISKILRHYEFNLQAKCVLFVLTT